MGNGGSACDAQHVAVEFIHPDHREAAGLARARPGQPDPGPHRHLQRQGFRPHLRRPDRTAGASPTTWPWRSPPAANRPTLFMRSKPRAKSGMLTIALLRQGRRTHAGSCRLLLHRPELQHSSHPGIARCAAAHSLGPDPCRHGRGGCDLMSSDTKAAGGAVA